MTDHIINVTAQRKQAQELRARADAIDAALDLLAGLNSLSFPIAERAVTLKQNNPAGRGRGKQPGAMSEKWKNHLANVYHFAKGARFSIVEISTVVRRETGRLMRRAELRRHLQAYVDAGHLAYIGVNKNSEELYELTRQGFEKIGLVQTEKSPAEQSEGLFSGHVAERSNASDS